MAMSKRRVRIRKRPLQVTKIIEQADAALVEPPPPGPTVHSHAGWTWEDGGDPYTQSA